MAMVERLTGDINPDYDYLSNNYFDMLDDYIPDENRANNNQ